MREVLLVLFSVSVCALLFRSQLSTALVLRGDDLLARGDAPGALEKYERALRFDASNGAALDRVLFAALQDRRTETLRRVLGRADAYLARHPQDTAVLQDRALCELLLRRRATAADDLLRVARLTGDAQMSVFAAIAKGKR